MTYVLIMIVTLAGIDNHFVIDYGLSESDCTQLKYDFDDPSNGTGIEFLCRVEKGVM